MTAADLPPVPGLSTAETALATLDSTAQLVEFLTGVKAQYVAAGWTPAAAEQITIEIFKRTGPQ